MNCLNIVFDLYPPLNVIFNINMYYFGALLIGHYVYLLSFYNCGHLLHTATQMVPALFFNILRYICRSILYWLFYLWVIQQSFLFIWQLFYDIDFIDTSGRMIEFSKRKSVTWLVRLEGMYWPGYSGAKCSITNWKDVEHVGERKSRKK